MIIYILVVVAVGFLVGLLARALLPGNNAMGFLGTTVLGIVGSFLGGYLGPMVTHGRIGDFRPAGWVFSIIGAMVILLVAHLFTRRGRR